MQGVQNGKHSDGKFYKVSLVALICVVCFVAVFLFNGKRESATLANEDPTSETANSRRLSASTPQVSVEDSSKPVKATDPVADEMSAAAMKKPESVENPARLDRGGSKSAVSPGQAPVAEPGKAALASEKIVEAETHLSPQEFMARLKSAVASGNTSEIARLVEGAVSDPGMVHSLQAIMGDIGSNNETKKLAAEALVRIGTDDSLQYILGQLLAAYRSGDTAGADMLLAALETPTTEAGRQVIFDFLLGRGNYARTGSGGSAESGLTDDGNLPSKADQEAVKQLSERLFTVTRSSEYTNIWQQQDGASHPLVLAQMVARAYQDSNPESAMQYLERIVESGNPGAVQALVHMVPNPSVPLDDAAMALYDWSVAHAQSAQPSLFIEYMTDPNRAPEQRSVAAFGLAGCSNSEYAQQAIQKALELETDPAVRENMQAALALMKEKQDKK